MARIRFQPSHLADARGGDPRGLRVVTGAVLWLVSGFATLGYVAWRWGLYASGIGALVIVILGPMPAVAWLWDKLAPTKWRLGLWDDPGESNDPRW